MRTLQDVVFDESRPFYPRPAIDASPASLVDPLSFLVFPDAPPASLPIPRSPLPSSVSSSVSPPVVSDYTAKPPVTQFYSRRGARLSDAPASSDELSSDVPSSSFTEDESSPSPIEPSSPIDFSPEQLVRRSHRLRTPPDYYSPSAFTVTALSEPASYHDAILHPECVRNRTLTLIEREDDTRSWENFLIYFSHSTTMSCPLRGWGYILIGC
jgi:hypothetical protein